MKVYSRSINTGETFCTSLKAAKSIFENTEVKLCFGEFSREYNPHQNEIGFGYYKKNIAGQVVAHMVLEYGVNCPLLKFYVIKSNIISVSLKDDFEHNVLPALFYLYIQFHNNMMLQKQVVWVELLNNSFKIHTYAS